jgi:hypothetical protein
MQTADFTLISSDPHRTVRSLAATHGFCDSEYDGELRTTFDGTGRTLRYLRSSGVSLDRFGEMLVDHGVTSRRLGPAEVADLLSATFDSRPHGKVAKMPSAKAISNAERRARANRSRKYQCEKCGQIVRGTRNTIVACMVCFEMTGQLVTLKRVDPLPEEIAAVAR